MSDVEITGAIEEDQVQAEEHQRELEEEQQKAQDVSESLLADFKEGVVDALLNDLKVAFPVKSEFYRKGHKFGQELYDRWCGVDVQN